MLIIPAIDLKKDKVVRLYKGDFNKISHYTSSPEEVFSRYLAAQIRRLHLIFLWGAYSGSITDAEESVIDRIIRVRDLYGKDCTIQTGGGMRTRSRISGLIEKGMDYVIVGTAFLIPLALEEGFLKNDIRLFYQQGGKEFNEENELPEFDLIDRIEEKVRSRIIVAIDYRNDETALSGWQVTVPLTPHYVMKCLMKRGYEKFILTNVEKDGTLEGVDTDSIEKIIDRVFFEGYQPEEIMISGGISSENDVQKLEELKHRPDGVIIGKALYQNRFNLKKAVLKFQCDEKHS